MENFIFNKYTKLHFGREMISSLGESILEHTKGPILLTYGGGSIKASGLYDNVISLLEASNIEFIELNGIKPNPEVSTARAGIKLIKDNEIDFILAVGGGSVLDNSKHMAIGSASEHDIWDIISGETNHDLDETKLPKIGSIITLAATGSEMNDGGVMSNPEVDLKLGYGHPMVAPVFTYEDPTQLFTLPEYQRRAGLCDILSHLFEVYFDSPSDIKMADRLVEAIMKNTIDNGDDYIKGNDYDTCANIFWSSTLALNGLTKMGRSSSDWRSHSLEHEISAFTDLTHGIGLAIVHPKVLDFYFKQDVKAGNSLIKYENIGVNVFELSRNEEDLAEKTIELIKATFKYFGGVEYLEDVKISDLDNELIAKRNFTSDTGGYYMQLDMEQTRELVSTFYRK